ncbi:MAG: hypothetical protein AAGD05_17750, partial [Bacteroidota bacterium]
MIKLPQELLLSREAHRSIVLEGMTIIESCFYEDQLEDDAYTTEHELIYLLSGELVIEVADESMTVRAGEAMLAKRGTYFHFCKRAKVMGQNYESILFFIKKDFVNAFIQTYQLKAGNPSNVHSSIAKIPNSSLMDGFMQSLLPYFDQPLRGKKALLRLKTFELLIQI